MKVWEVKRLRELIVCLYYEKLEEEVEAFI